jgi:hypothetical protein
MTHPNTIATADLLRPGEAPGGHPSHGPFPAGGCDLDAARCRIASPAGHSDAALAEACRTLLSYSARAEDHVTARELLKMLKV